MIQTQRNYLEYVQKVQECLEKQIGKAEFSRPFPFSQIIEVLQNAKLLVLVVGGFSSGKSTFINSFLGKEALPVGITPETALAAEIHFSEREKLIAMKTNEQFEEFSLNEFPQVTQNAKNYQSLKVYLNQPELKNLYPLVLVDMPGFDSPLDAHNKAILEYLEKSSHYLFLIDIGDGNITQSMKSQIIKIQELNKTCSFFLSKSNLKPESEVQEVKEKIEEQIQDDFDFTSSVLPINQDGGENLQKVLKKIDRDQLFENEYKEAIKSEYYGKIINALDTTIRSLNRDTKQNDEEIEALKKGEKEIETKKEEMILEAESEYTNVNQVVQDIGNDIANIVDQLIEIENPELLKQRLNDEIRNSTIRHVNSSLQNMISSISVNYSSILNSIETENTEKLSNQILASVNLLSSGMKGMKWLQLGGKAGAAAGFLTGILNPLFAVASLLLPEIIEFFTKKSQKKKLRNQILTQVIPSMKSKLESEISTLFIDKKKELIEKIGEQFEGELKQKQEQIQQAEEERKKVIKNIEQEIEKYKQAKQEIEILALNKGIKK